MIKLSVLASTFNRAKLIDRALATYAKQTLDPKCWEYVLVDDGSQDETLEVAAKWKSAGVPIRVFDVAKDLGRPKEPGKWRDGSIGRNAGSTMCRGEVLVCTHPEIMVPPDALEVAYESVCRQPHAWHTAIPYWMPEASDEFYEECGWENWLPHLRSAAGFYSDDWPKDIGVIDYRNQNQERRRTWESEVWFAMSMNLWRGIGGFREFEVWGPVDVDFMNRRRAIGIKTNILTSLNSEALSGNLMVYHQWHPSPRNMELCEETLRKHGCNYANANQAIQVGGLYKIWNSGPRERHDSNYKVLGDHIDRYKFAANYSAGKVVLDMPCGSGYGAEYLNNAYRYVGIDADAESIGWARSHHRAINTEFYQGDMLDIPLLDEVEGRFDLAVCFEGIEHIEHQKEFLINLGWLLKAGGTFIISTPQKGVANGTPWDKHMLTKEELYEMAEWAGFTNLEWFHQRNYGGAEGMNPVVKGEPGSEDHIMILGGQKGECK